MDRKKLIRIDEDLGSSEVAALCFLCRDVVGRRTREGVQSAAGLFLILEEKGLMDNEVFLSQLLRTIHRLDLLNILETDSREPVEADANPLLSDYSVMLYDIYQNMSERNFKHMKFLLDGHLEKRKLETCKTALDVFTEMESQGLMSNCKLDMLHTILLELDKQLATTVQRYMTGLSQPAVPPPPHVSMDYQRVDIFPQRTRPPETRPSTEEESVPDSTATQGLPSLPDPSDYYTLSHIPRGLCVIINNEDFQGGLRRRGGTQEDEKSLNTVFSRLGFTVVVHNNMTADAIHCEMNRLSMRNFLDEDALVVCVLSHGEKGSVYGSDGVQVFITDLTSPFRSGKTPTLTGKPKLFFIQACQGRDYQGGSTPCPPRPSQQGEERQSRLEEDAGPVQGETVPHDADLLLGMATVQDYKSFRNTAKGSIFIQELCRQLSRSAESTENDDILSVMTRVNRLVSGGVYLNHKQMPEPRYTLTKKLVLKYVK